MDRLRDPGTMTPAARRAEVAAILASGFLRLWLGRADVESKGQDVLPTSSHSCLGPSSEERGETWAVRC